MANQYFTCTLNASVSGQNVSAYMNYSRSGTYTYQDTALPVPTMTIDGTNYSDNAFKNAVASGVSVGSVNTSTFTKACANGNRTVTFTCGAGLRSDFQGTWSKTVTVNYTPPSSPPTGLAVTFGGSKHNSVTCSVSVTGWGTPVGNNRYLEAGIRKTNSSGFGNLDRFQSSAQGVNSPQTLTVTNSSTDRGYGKIKGCQAFKIEAYASNGTATTSIAPNTTYYTPPYGPLSTYYGEPTKWTKVSHTETKVRIPLTGGNSDENESVNVETRYRYSIDDGPESNWISLGTGLPWETKYAEITAPAGSKMRIEPQQVYQSQTSQFIRYVYTMYKAPEGVQTLYISNVTKNRVDVNGVVLSYGIPKIQAGSGSGSYLEVGIFESNSGVYNTLPRRIMRAMNANEGSICILPLSSNSEPQSGATFRIEPNTKYYIGIYAINKYSGFITQSGDGSGQASDYQEVITSPETTEVTLTDTDIDTATGTVTANMHATLLGLGGGESVLTPSYRYSIDGGTTWSGWTDLAPDTLEQDFVISRLPFNTMITVESKTTGVRDSEISTMTFRTNPEPILIDTFDWEFDELRRNKIIWKLNIKPGYTVEKDAVLTIKSHDVELMNHSSGLSATAEESLPAIYKPNETLSWSLTVSTTGISQTITGDITMPRPILGLTIGPDGEKRYITDMIKGGGAETSDDFILDARYDKFQVKT